MFSYLFKNRWMALIFVLTGAYGAATLVGTEEDEGLVVKTAQKVEENRSRASGGDWGDVEALPPEPREYEEDGAIDEQLANPWAVDGDEISPDEFSEPFVDGLPMDAGTGFEPTPMDDPAPTVQGSPLAGPAGLVILPE
ncbi:hypothetical protein HME9302_02187 [Alteripontixanthobacter maritimus]|uniref:Secreted protein n=1 Tax=Alteripontixanthobacter maritimus TaxID=2161824 RepID=A0A369Q9D9_9SPHN|nr:hypothetical protein [Alteripontixanthobacter maritimus]RDC60970.1 hypothetical protein HME9302_02187 [Alteripontixanthobacter maritimus]